MAIVAIEAHVNHLLATPAGRIPLWLHFVWPIATAVLVSLTATAVASCSLDVAKGRSAKTGMVRGGLGVLVIGAAAAAVGYGIGWLGPPLAG